MNEHKERASDKHSPSLAIRLKHLTGYFPSDSDVLEIGCGEGYISDILQKKGNRIVAFDYSKEAIGKAKQRNDKVKFIVSDFKEFSYDKKFDYIIMTEVFEHLDLPDEVVFQKVISFIKQDGVIIFSIPLVHHKHDYHVKQYSFNQFVESMEKNGLELLAHQEWGSRLYEYIQGKGKDNNNRKTLRKNYDILKYLLVPLIFLESKINIKKKCGLIALARKK